MVFLNIRSIYTVPKLIDFQRYNTKGSEEDEILRRIFYVVSRFPLHSFHVISRKFGLLFEQCTVSSNPPFIQYRSGAKQSQLY